jgi:ubiquinone/menaquinone biosynthesis C-methylase UbiE/uncharacterized protein YbaR (Trm112 family)
MIKGGNKMNSYVQDYLISPETNCPLLLVDNTDEGLKNGILQGNDSSDVFNIVNGIPILLPSRHIADYNVNTLDIIYKERTCEIDNEILSKIGNNLELYKDEMDKYILEHSGKEGVLKAYEEYSRLSINQKLSWYATLDKDQENDNKTQIPASTIKSSLTYETAEIGRKRFEITDEMIYKWAVHLNDYGNLVTESKSGIIVELATGMGIGTCGVIKSGLGSSNLISVDIDYACTVNAIGIAKYKEVENKVDPIVANFWYLPFKNDSIDVVCSHYGLDESREITRILSEISRVLQYGGKFINVSRKDPTLRLKHTFGHLDFCENQYINLANWGGFYCGMDDLRNKAEKYNLILEYHKIYSPDYSHERILSVFKKI